MHARKVGRLAAMLIFILGVVGAGRAQPADPEVAKLEKQRCSKPKEFANVFSFGYAGDQMPRDDTKFEHLLVTIKEGGFNTIHCTYTPRRLELCKKHGIKMMIDLLAPEHHVYKSADKAQAVCEKLRNNPDVWGYNIWNDTFAKTGEGRRRDINTVRKWDPTHPAFSGTYRTAGMSHLVNADIMGYYDFHWTRGINSHFGHLMAFRKWALERDAWFYTWLSSTSGQPGKGNFNCSLYSANTGMACGLKGVLWFLATDMMKNEEWTDGGRDILKVNKEIMPLSQEIPRLGVPTAVYSTAITRTPNNTPVPEGKKAVLPPGLDNNAFPKDFWVQPVAGEFVVGVFKDDAKRDVLFLANHNAYAEQKVVLKLRHQGPVSLFNRKTGKWEELKATEGMVQLDLSAGGGELVRVGQ